MREVLESDLGGYRPQWHQDLDDLEGACLQADVCQLARVWVSGRGRRRGLGRALVDHAVAWSTGPGGYGRVYLHTDADRRGGVLARPACP